jgi:class 3 adenylate cyclase
VPGDGGALEAVIGRRVTRSVLQAYLGLAQQSFKAAITRFEVRVSDSSVKSRGVEVYCDGLLAIFPLADHGEQAACDAAISAVRAARAGMARLDDERLDGGQCPSPFGVALHLGAVMYGNIGAPERLDFAAIGPAVNVASRIEELCRSLACPVLISEALAARCTRDLTALGAQSLRGIARPISLFTLPELVTRPG